MAAKSDLVRLSHVLEAARKALLFTKDKSRADLNTNEQLALALVRLLEIIGEAASKVTPETMKRYEALPWKRMIGTRNRLIHGYEQVDLDILWQIVTEDLRPLVDAVQKVIEEAEQQKKLF